MNSWDYFYASIFTLLTYKVAYFLLVALSYINLEIQFSS